jgi:hypothetical protein
MVAGAVDSCQRSPNRGWSISKPTTGHAASRHGDGDLQADVAEAGYRNPPRVRRRQFWQDSAACRLAPIRRRTFFFKRETALFLRFGVGAGGNRDCNARRSKAFPSTV